MPFYSSLHWQYKLAFQHPNNKCAITSSLPLTHRHTVQLTLHYKALQGNITAQLSPKSFQCCRGGQKSECLSRSCLAHSLSKWRQWPSCFPFPTFLVSLHLFVYPFGRRSVSLCLCPCSARLRTFRPQIHFTRETVQHIIKCVSYNQPLNCCNLLMHKQTVYTHTYNGQQKSPISLAAGLRCSQPPSSV